jgi:hypothetical protein
MTKQFILNQAILSISQLPVEKIREVADYAEYLLKKHEDKIILKGIEQMVNQSQAYEFLHDEEDIYTVADLKERYK